MSRGLNLASRQNKNDWRRLANSVCSKDFPILIAGRTRKRKAKVTGSLSDLKLISDVLCLNDMLQDEIV